MLSRDEYIKTILELRGQAQERRALAAPHAQGVGRHGPRPRRAGHGAVRGGQDPARARGSSTARRPTRATCTPCCTGPPTSRRRSTSSRCARGYQMSCFAMTEPEVAGSDPTLMRTNAVQGRRRVDHQRPQVVHLQRPPGQLRHPPGPHRDGRARGLAGRHHRLHRRHPVRGLERRARGRDHARLDRPQRDRHHRPAGARPPDPRRAGQGPPARPVPARARPAWPTACGGSPRPRRPST